MNRKIPFHELSALLADKCAITAAEAEDFVKSFFDLVADSLVEDGEVKIKGIGTFTRTESAETPVVFVPDQTLADGVNAPFAMFEPETLTDAYVDADTVELPAVADETPAVAELPAVADETPVAPELPTDAEETPAAAELPVAADETPAAPELPAAEETPAAPELPADAEETPAAPEQPDESVATPVSPVVAIAPMPSTMEEEEDEYLPQVENVSRGMSWGWGFVLGLILGLAIGACTVYFAIDYIFPTSARVGMESAFESQMDDEPIVSDDIESFAQDADNASETDSVAAPVAADSVKHESASESAHSVATDVASKAPATTSTEDARPATPKVKDTVKAGYLLPTMARKHYGNNCFWVYIYEENKNIIANPNRIKPGLTVVIPPADKYGIDPRSSASISKAKDKAAEILRKYPN